MRVIQAISSASAAIVCMATMASAAPVTYNFDDQWASRINPVVGNSVPGPTISRLQGFITVDTTETGDDVIVDYSLQSSLMSFAPSLSRMSDYTDGGLGDSATFDGTTFTFVSDAITIGGTFDGFASARDILTLTLTGGLPSTTFDANGSEVFRNCTGSFFPFPQNPCNGIAGSNGLTAFSGTSTISPVPLPAGLPLLAVGLAGLGLARRKRV